MKLSHIIHNIKVLTWMLLHKYYCLHLGVVPLLDTWGISKSFDLKCCPRTESIDIILSQIPTPSPWGGRWGNTLIGALRWFSWQDLGIAVTHTIINFQQATSEPWPCRSMPWSFFVSFLWLQLSVCVHQHSHNAVHPGTTVVRREWKFPASQFLTAVATLARWSRERTPLSPSLSPQVG